MVTLKSSMLSKSRLTKSPVSKNVAALSRLIPIRLITDVYNMQLSNEPAEELAKYLVSTGNNAFELCGFVSGGKVASFFV